MKRLFMVGALAALFANAALAAPYTVDQANDALPIAGGFTINAGPIGQSFVPTLNQLGVVELMINDQNPNFGAGVNLAVNIRDGDISGAILGTSQHVFFHDQSPMPFQQPEQLRFDFVAPVTLTPGHSYVIEPVRIDGGPSDQGVFGTGFGIDAYAPGVSFFNGAVYTDPLNAPFDLWFREGVVTSVPEPSTYVLGLIGLLAVVWHRKRFSR